MTTHQIITLLNQNGGHVTVGQALAAIAIGLLLGGALILLARVR